jgi:hypothetical protein
VAKNRGGWAGLVLLVGSAAALAACGGKDSAAPPSVPGGESTNIVAALSGVPDRTEAARAAAWAAEATRYRDIANHERQISAAYASWTPPAGVAVTKNWNTTLKPSADARAAAADQIAVSLQAIADFHTAAAANAGAQ